MNEKALPVLEQYDYEFNSQKRVRGTYCCESNKGLMLLKEYENSQGRIRIVETIQRHIYDSGMDVDLVVKNKDGELISVGPEGGSYILKKWFDYRDCECDNMRDVMGSLTVMSQFHAICRDMREYLNSQQIYLNDEISMEEESKDNSDDCIKKCRLLSPDDIKGTLDRHNRELVRVQRFLGKKKKKTQFEYDLERCIDRNYQKAAELSGQITYEESEQLRKRATERMSICHGNCRYHNFIIVEGRPVLINYIKVKVDNQIDDLYSFMKKIIEKNNYKPGLAEEMLRQYEKNNPLDATEEKALRVLVNYPHRMWKVANNYFNSSKSGYSLKNQEKLSKYISMEEKIAFP